MILNIYLEYQYINQTIDLFIEFSKTKNQNKRITTIVYINFFK